MDSKRQQLMEELITFARQTIEKAENDPVYIESEELSRRVTLAWHDGCPCLVSRLQCEGLSPAQYKKWTETYLDAVKRLAPPNVTYEGLPEDGGCKVVWQRIDPQVMFVSARSLIVSAYGTKQGDEEIFVLSTKGNEHLVEANQEKLGQDVVADLIVNCMFFKPLLDSCGDECGTEVTQVYSMNPKGSLPSIAVNFLIGK